MTASQQAALTEYGPRFCVPAGGGRLDMAHLFGRQAPCLLEIGFGMGDALLAMAQAHPENDYLGIEVYRPGIGSLLNRLVEHRIGNVRIVCDDAVEVLERRIAPRSLDGVYLFFPDPWPKKRHHKRRIVQPGFIRLLASRLKPGGLLHMATDWEDYALHMAEVMAQTTEFQRLTGEAAATCAAARPGTKFERRGRRAGHGIHDLVYVLAGGASGLTQEQ